MLERLRVIFNGHTREEIACAAQILLEDIVLRYIHGAVRRTGCGNVCLSGGIFANIRLNQKIWELNGIKSVYVFPHMGDGGLACGAGALASVEASDIKGPREIETPFLGPYLDDTSANHFPRELPASVAKLLASRKVVGIVRGRMEYGPRALGHRSILAEPTDTKMKCWLNQRLNRTDFMPFAPVILEGRVKQYFKTPDKFELCGKYMTSTVDVTRLCMEKAPGIVHIDGTARPQIVSRANNPFIHEVLLEFEKLTGLPLCVNTSFNMHDEPIINSSKDAIEALRNGTVDALVLADRIVENNK